MKRAARGAVSPHITECFILFRLFTESVPGAVLR